MIALLVVSFQFKGINSQVTEVKNNGNYLSLPRCFSDLSSVAYVAYILVSAKTEEITMMLTYQGVLLVLELLDIKV